MAAQYTEVTLDEMDRFLKRAWRAYRPKQGTDRGEVYYDLFLSDHVMIRVWTTIHPRREMGADVGADAIRIMLMAKKTQRPLLKGKAPIVKRTQGWKNSLQDRIEDAIETYEDREGYFEERAGGEVQQTLPGTDPDVNRDDEDPGNKAERLMAEREMREEQEREELERKEPPPPPRRTDLQATFTKLKNGDWGLRVEGNAGPGDRVLAITKGGKKQYMVLGEIVWSGRDSRTGEFISVGTIARTLNASENEEPLRDEEEPPYTYGRA
jgi:hypothetical protein